MKLLTYVAPAALLAAMTVSGGAMAQTMVGGHTVSDEDLPRVQAYCDSLAAQANESLAESLTDDGDDGDDGDDDADGNVEHQTDADPASEDGGADGIDQALTDFDLNTITLEQCREAGLAEPGRVVVQ